MKTNKSAARAVDLLMLLAKNTTPMTLLEIETAMEIPKSSTFELVYTLLDKGFLEQIDKKYTVGINAFVVGLGYSKRLDLIQDSKFILEDLSCACKETVFLGKLVQNNVVYVDKHANYAGMASTCSVGSQRGMYYTGLGKAILACKTEQQVRDYFINAQITPYSERTIVTIEDMLPELARIRKRGFATEIGEGPIDAYCVAAPILDYTGNAIAAVSITAPSFHMTEEKGVYFGELIQNAALAISRKMGYLGNQLYGQNITDHL